MTEFQQWHKNTESENRLGFVPSGLTEFSNNELSLVQLSPTGPKVEKFGSGSSPYEKNAIPEQQISPEERARIEALPVLKDETVCSPLTAAEAKKFGPGPIGYCNPVETSELSEEKKNMVREDERIHLGKDDKVAKVGDNEYLIIHPLPRIYD